MSCIHREGFIHIFYEHTQLADMRFDENIGLKYLKLLFFFFHFSKYYLAGMYYHCCAGKYVQRRCFMVYDRRPFSTKLP